MERGLTGLTGYGPSNLTFDGNDERYELWEVKFRAYLDLKSLNSVLEGEESSLDVVKNKQVFSELVQRLDDKSLSLIIRDAYGDGRKSMKILRDHYLGSSKPRIIALYCELAALKMQNGETVTDYLLRAETTASYLKRAGEMISDGLIIAMIIRGLPAAYNAFSTVVTQRDSAEMDFQKFKSALKSEEETKGTRQSHSENEERDNGTEYSSRLFKAVVMDNKIKHEFTAPCSPHQNGTAERSWKSLFEKARCLLLHANRPKELWNHAVRTAAYIRNRSFNKRTGKTPFEMFTGKKPDISNMHIFGSKCFAKRQNSGKLDPRSEQGFFVGYDPCSPAYLIYFPETHQIKRVRCVTFCDKISRDVMIEDVFIAVDNPAELKQSGKTDKAEAGLKPGTVPEGIQNKTHLDEKPIRRFPLREKKPPIYLKDYVDQDECDITNHVVDYCYRVNSIPKSYPEAISSPDSVEWQKAMSDEMATLVENETFELVAKPKERSVIGSIVLNQVPMIRKFSKLVM
ncbi:Integrase catalytic core [Trinorchestia longiramus]|nr:Integrase catalytic core [Trinorchestia longiramus]